MYSTPNGYPQENKNPCNVNGIRIDECYNMCTVWGVCIELLHWWNSKYRLRHTDVRSMDSSSTALMHLKMYNDFLITFLLEEAALLLEYKTQAQRENRQGAPSCSARKLCHQILNVVHLFGENASDHWEILVAASSEFCGEQLSMGGPKKEHLKVVELDHPQVFGEGHLFLFKYCSQF